jgi:hypothetical protein
LPCGEYLQTQNHHNAISNKSVQFILLNFSNIKNNIEGTAVDKGGMEHDAFGRK